MGLKENNKEISILIADELLEVGAIKLNKEKPFQWASGWKSPIYCDNRMTLSFPKTRTLIKNELVDLIKREFKDAEVIAGVATAGIPQAALIAEVLELPLVYVRDKPKGHGMQNLIEGKLPVGKKVVVIEDLISTGGSSLKAVESLRESGATVIGMVAIFTYGFQKAVDNFKSANVPLITLSNYAELLQAAIKKGVIVESDLPLLQDWQKAPEAWGV
jgi:orotate phosphoribosyltransferase